MLPSQKLHILIFWKGSSFGWHTWLGITSHRFLSVIALRAYLVVTRVSLNQINSSQVVFINIKHKNNNHRLNGSSSHVLTATPHSYGKGQNSTPYKIKTPQRIGMKFGTVDYVPEKCPQNKFGDDRSSGGFWVIWVNMWNIRCLWLSLFFSPTDLEATPPNQYLRKMA